MRILVLDDDRALRDAIRRILDQYDFQVDCCDNARNAVSMVQEKEYDFVLVDYRMPGDDGLWFMKNANLSLSCSAQRARMPPA